jgi:hypothetical protein
MGFEFGVCYLSKQFSVECQVVGRLGHMVQLDHLGIFKVRYGARNFENWVNLAATY